MARERSRNHQKFQNNNNKILENILLKSNITITSLHFKITLIEDNINDNNKEWL